MKLFVAEKRNKGYISETNYHWCDNDDILIFGEFQTDDINNPKDVSMCGIASRAYTTHILVKDINIPYYYLFELIKDSTEKSMECYVNTEGDYIVDLGEFKAKFNIHDRIKELTEKANKFNDGDKVICRGRTITKID